MTVFLNIYGTLCLAYWIILIIHNKRPFFSLFWIWPLMWAACILCSLAICITGNTVPAIILTSFICAATAFVLYFTYIMINACRINAQHPKPDYIIVPGAHVRGSRITRVFAWRLEAALNEYMKHPSARIITTGGRGRGENISEAESGKIWLIQHGISESSVITECTSSTTRENLKNTLCITERPDLVYGIATSDFHIYRSLEIARATGFAHVYGIPARTSVLSRIHNALRESLAICSYRLIHRNRA